MFSKVGRLVIYILTQFRRAAFDILPSYPIPIQGYDKQSFICLKIQTKFDFKTFNKLTNVQLVVLRISKQKQIKTRFK